MECDNNLRFIGSPFNSFGKERERISMELSRNLMVESVARLVPTPPYEVAANRCVADAVAALRQQRVGCLLCIDDGKLVGIFTERDLLTRIIALGLPLSTPLRECMTLKPVTVHPMDSVRTAIERMEYGGYRHLPVVDDQQHPDRHSLGQADFALHRRSISPPRSIVNRPTRRTFTRIRTGRSVSIYFVTSTNGLSLVGQPRQHNKVPTLPGKSSRN